ncbi:MAG: ABC transporter permease subunit, partial [Pseudomonadota bacterium]
MDILGTLGLRKDAFVARKTVTFGDESAVTANRVASIVSITTIFLFWGMFTGSAWVPLHVPAPFEGETGFSYTVTEADGQTHDADVTVLVIDKEASPPPAPPEDTDGVARDDYVQTTVRIGATVRVLRNDADRGEGMTISAINGRAVSPGDTVAVPGGEVLVTPRSTLFFRPALGLQTDPIYLPPPEKVVSSFVQIWNEGYRDTTLGGHVGWSLFRVIAGFVCGALVGIPLGIAMGLNSWVRGAFDPIVEFMRPVPPLALIPLVIIWAGIGETAKIILLFLAALWIMAIAARAGVSGVALSKVHAPYSPAATKWQIPSKVFFHTARTEIYTG